MSWRASPARKISRPFKISVVESPRRQWKSEASCPAVVARVILKNEPVNRTSHRCSFQWLAFEMMLRSWLVEIYRRTHMEIFCIFIDSLEWLCDLHHIFDDSSFSRNFSRDRPLRHLEHVITSILHNIRTRMLRGSIERTQQSGPSNHLILPRPRPPAPYSQRRGVP